MSDFLTRLAARTLGEAPLAQPLSPPPFAQTGEFEIADPSLSAVEQSISREDVFPVPRDLDSFVDKSPPSAEVQHDFRVDHPPRERIPDQVEFPHTITEDSVIPGRSRSHRNPAPSPKSDEENPRETTSALPEPPWLILTNPRQGVPHDRNLTSAWVQSGPDAQNRANLLPSEPTPEQAPAPFTSPPRLVQSIPLAANLETPSTASAEIPQKSVLAETSESRETLTPDLNPLARDRSLARNVLPSQVPETRPRLNPIREAPPEIRITIGRIEVRAVSQPAPPSRQPIRPRPPSLSLDDYLKQRNEN